MFLVKTANQSIKAELENKPFKIIWKKSCKGIRIEKTQDGSFQR